MQAPLLLDLELLQEVIKRLIDALGILPHQPVSRVGRHNRKIPTSLLHPSLHERRRHNILHAVRGHEQDGDIRDPLPVFRHSGIIPIVDALHDLAVPTDRSIPPAFHEVVIEGRELLVRHPSVQGTSLVILDPSSCGAIGAQVFLPVLLQGAEEQGRHGGLVLGDQGVGVRRVEEVPVAGGWVAQELLGRFVHCVDVDASGWAVACVVSADLIQSSTEV